MLYIVQQSKHGQKILGITKIDENQNFLSDKQFCTSTAIVPVYSSKPSLYLKFFKEIRSSSNFSVKNRTSIPFSTYFYLMQIFYKILLHFTTLVLTDSSCQKNLQLQQLKTEFRFLYIRVVQKIMRLLRVRKLKKWKVVTMHMQV